MMACFAFLSSAFGSSVLLRMEVVAFVPSLHGIEKDTLLNTEAVDILGGKGVESSRGQGVMF